MTVMPTHIAMLDAIDHAVIATDAAGKITYWSKAAETLYGWRREEVQGRPIVEVTPADISREEAASIMESLASGFIWSGVFPVRDRGGREFRVAVTDLPIIQNHQVVGVIGVSYPDGERSPLRHILEQFGASVKRRWPSQIETDIDDLGNAAASVSDPHVLQLLALLLMRETKALEAGESVSIEASRATPNVQVSLGFSLPASRCAHIRILRGGPVNFRDTIRPSDESHYAAMLVQRAGGRLYTGSTPAAPSSAHLFLPIGI